MVVGALGLLAATAGGAQAATRYVAANGIDLGNCGTLAQPCRSISQAIAVVDPGDRILVGPGRYGDLNRNGTFSEAGEEPSEQTTGCLCMIHVTKRLTLESVGGAGVTIVDATGAAAAIRISASDVVIGRRNRGFTFTGAGTEGLIAQNVDGLHLEDNVFTRNQANGISMNGDDHVVTGNVASHNINNAGFAIGGVASRGISVMNNLAVGNQQQGFNLRGLSMRVMGNVAGDNRGTGFSVFWDGAGIVFTGNVSAGNEDKGFVLGSGAGITGAVARRNAAIANLRGGIFMAGDGVHVTQSNIFGNGVLPDMAGAGGLVNCGIISGLPTPVVADNNFWGSAAGPDFDPADQVCVRLSGSVDATPFATRPFTIVPGAGR
jgi:hypothetical protein